MTNRGPLYIVEQGPSINGMTRTSRKALRKPEKALNLSPEKTFNI
jgi:hypothetical protein